MRKRNLKLPCPFASRSGVPVLKRVDPAIFLRRYFTHCLACGFCRDQCCTYGVDVDLETVQRINEHADDLERFSGIPRDQWFSGEVEADDALPGGGSWRTGVANGRCVFHNRGKRGCLLHLFSLDKGLDYHQLKSIVDCLFPLTFDDDLLCPADEVDDGSLVCLDTGPTLYRGVREEVRYYFGTAFIEALDRMEAWVRERNA